MATTNVNARRALKACSDDAEKYINKLKEGREAIMTVAVSVTKHKEDDQADDFLPEVKNLEGLLKKLIENEHQLKAHIAGMQRLEPEISDTIEEIQERNLQDLLNKFQSEAASSSAHKQELSADIGKQQQHLKRKVWDVYHRGKPMPGDDADDIVEVEARSAATICPISQLALEEPMKNKNCAHTYSKRAVEEYIKNKVKGENGSCVCPAAGCQKRVSLDSLEVDVEAAVLAKKEKKRKRRAEVDAGDDDDEASAPVHDLEEGDDKSEVEDKMQKEEPVVKKERLKKERR